MLSLPQLIIRADNMGTSQSSNLASIIGYNSGIVTSVEVMPVAPWFPDAVRLLKENASIDVGVQLALSSEWDNIKWRPLTHCPSLIDENGYFRPTVIPNENYPGMAITETEWDLGEIEKEFRAQIEMALNNLPQISHISAHMGATSFDVEIANMVKKLAAEYGLADISSNSNEDHGIYPIDYSGAHVTNSEKKNGFIRTLDRLDMGHAYVFAEQPALNNTESRSIYYKGYENAAEDRQGAMDLLTDEDVKSVIDYKAIQLVSYNDVINALPRSNSSRQKVNERQLISFVKEAAKQNIDLHSFMVVRNGQVVFERWMGHNSPRKNQDMFAIGKTLTALAIGFAISEGDINLNDKVISFFPDDLPQDVSNELKQLEIRHLLTNTAGLDPNVSAIIRDREHDWVKAYLADPFTNIPGTKFEENNLNAYMLSAILQHVSGSNMLDYLYPRLFRPLGIVGVEWEKNPDGITKGGWGLRMKLEDMAKLGQFMLQKGKWNDKQLLPKEWMNEVSKAQVRIPLRKGISNSDWNFGYGYQIWRSKNNSFRADGEKGQFIIVIPNKNTVIAVTGDVKNPIKELNLLWKYLLSALN